MKMRVLGNRKKQSGLVLIVAIVLLAIVSVLAAFTTRNAASTEAVSGNVRLTELATQAAELALRHCEQSVARVITEAAGGTPPSPLYPTDFTEAHILPAGSESNWESPGVWDSVTPHVYVLPLAKMNQPGLTVTYKRPPECMVARVPTQLASGAMSTQTLFVITARGFGPEVPAADLVRSRPVGSEVWLQSHIELQ
jgi:type IV pilus assembly protein PilX